MILWFDPQSWDSNFCGDQTPGVPVTPVVISFWCKGSIKYVISWFRFAPVTIVINTINHCYWGYLHQLSYRTGASHCRKICELYVKSQRFCFTHFSQNWLLIFAHSIGMDTSKSTGHPFVSVSHKDS